MFSFLNSTVLLAAAAALIPLIIHLFSRRRIKVIEFSSLRHLKEMQRRQLRRLKIRQLLLLIIRMLIILAVVLAFARPTVREGGVGAHASVSAVIMFDNSASMNQLVADGNYFDLARKRTLQLLETFAQSDEVCLLSLDRSAGDYPAEFATAAAAAATLDRLTPGVGRADYDGRLEKAAELLATAQNFNKELYLVTDRQRTSLPTEPENFESGIASYLVDVKLNDHDNVGVIQLDFGGQLIQPGHDFDLVATIHNYGRRAATDKIASLFLDGRRVAQTDFAVTAGSEMTVRFTRAVSRTGFHSGQVEISDDGFPGDNRYYFSFHVPEQFNVLIVHGDEAADFIGLALEPLTDGSNYWSVKRVAPTDLAGVNFGDYDVVVLAGSPQLDLVYVSRIKTFVQRGNALYLTYGGATDIREFNATWSDVTGVTYDQAVATNFSRAGFYTLASIDRDHPIFSVFALDEVSLPELRFYALPKMRAAARAKVVAQFSGDHPALVETTYGSGKVLTFAGPMAPKYSDLTAHGFFVPFQARVMEYLASDLSSLELRLFAGESVTRSLSPARLITGEVELLLPDSTRRSLVPEESQSTLVVRTGVTEQAGIFSLRYGESEVDRFAINIDPDECNLTPTDPDQFALALGIDELKRLEADDQLASALAEFRVGRELWQLFLWAAILLLALEMLLGRSSMGKEAS